MKIQQYNFALSSAGAHAVHANVSGTFIRCLVAAAPFALSIDGGTDIQFSLGNTITIPDGFSLVTVKFDETMGYPATLAVRLMIGSGAEFYDARNFTYDTSRSKIRGADSFVSVNVVQPTLISPPVQVHTLNASAGTFMVSVRNTDATNSIKIACLEAASLAALVAGHGVICAPGEIVDLSLNFPALPDGTSNGLAVYAAVGVTYTVTWFLYLT